MLNLAGREAGTTGTFLPPGQGGSTASKPDDREALLEVRDLRLGFTREGVREEVGLAVDGVGFSLEGGKTLCLVGESGCGKSVAALHLLRLLPSPPAKILGGTVRFKGQDLGALSETELNRIRGDRICMIFQDPMSSLNPVMRIGAQMGEGLRLHRGLSARAAAREVEAVLERVGMPDPAGVAREFPHRLSGGMRQRVMIGMAVLPGPDLIIADEATTALDAVTGKRILDLLRSLTESSGASLLFITHDLGIVARIADDTAVMYAGRIVEYGPTGALLAKPVHPYTVGLLRSSPANLTRNSSPPRGSPARSGRSADIPFRERRRRLAAIPGAVPGIWDRPAGCSFHPRCAYAVQRCSEEDPLLRDAGGTFSRCAAGAHSGDRP
ncbi:MAG: ABC transporter ATP-binding protein [Desulfovibrio sp.]|jgi:peptide/nickel transport system ATP-binding protein|nr:ABC transporter ATP-binding protein [Desulfovibrio sp.]